MDDKEEEKLREWINEEVIPKANFIGANLKKHYTPEKADQLLPAVLQLAITPHYYFEKETRRKRNELLAKLKERLKEEENKKKFTTFVHVEDVPYKAGAKPIDVAESLSNQLLKKALRYMEEH